MSGTGKSCLLKLPELCCVLTRRVGDIEEFPLLVSIAVSWMKFLLEDMRLGSVPKAREGDGCLRNEVEGRET